MKQGPIRTCVGCCIKKKKQGLIRFTLKSGRLFIDMKSEYGGKGWYLCYNMECLEKIKKKGSLKGASAVSKNELQRFLSDSTLEGILNVKKYESS